MSAGTATRRTIRGHSSMGGEAMSAGPSVTMSSSRSALSRVNHAKLSNYLAVWLRAANKTRPESPRSRPR